jgi:hypothetical protein
MNWQTLSQILGAGISGIGITAGGLFLFGRDLLNKAVTARLEQEKIAYEQTFKERLATLESELERISKRQEIEYHWYYQKRAEAIDRIYTKLVNLWAGANNAGAFNLKNEDGPAKYKQLFEETRDDIGRSRLFFESHTYAKLNALVIKYNAAEDFIQMAKDEGKEGRDMHMNYLSSITHKHVELIDELQVLLMGKENSKTGSPG